MKCGCLFTFISLLVAAFAGAVPQCLVGSWAGAVPPAVPQWASMQIDISLRGDTGVNVNVTWIYGTSVTQNISLSASTALETQTTQNRHFFSNINMAVEKDVSKPTVYSVVQQNSDGLAIQETATLLFAQGSIQQYILSHVLHCVEDGITYCLTPSAPYAVTNCISLKRTWGIQQAESNSAKSTVAKFDVNKYPVFEKLVPMEKVERVTEDSTAFVFTIPNNWTVVSDVFAVNAMLIGLQGLANRDQPQLYYMYPDDWSFNLTPEIFMYYKEKRGIKFQNVTSTEDLLIHFNATFQCLVIWDIEVVSTLNLAFTVSGLYNCLPVTEHLLELFPHNTRVAADFRNVFRGATDFEVYSYAKHHWWASCSRHAIAWLGGSCGAIFQPAIADYGVAHKAFFTNLDTADASNPEYGLAYDLLGQMEVANFSSFGWHSYCKDTEHTYVTALSTFGGTPIGLDTNPNLSFIAGVPASDGFVFKNNNNGTQVTSPPNKVLLALVQTDGIGLGAWGKPGRGKIPYAWEVSIDSHTYTPSLLELFYSQATPNDYFIAAISGPGYIYPKSTPPAILNKLLKRTIDGFPSLDLHVMEIFDATDVLPHCGTSSMGDTTLNKTIVDTYFNEMPHILGFLNGYGPSFTVVHHDSNGTKPAQSLLSFDYYLDPARSVDDAVNDLQALAKFNTLRPYSLVMHVREMSSIDRVVAIVDRLGDEFEVVHLDYLLRVSAEYPNIKTRYH